MPNKIKTILGELVIAFAALEDSLAEGLAQIIDIDYMNAKIIFSLVSFQKKLKIIEALLRQDCSDEKYVDIYNLLSKAKSLEERRNQLIHSDWEYVVTRKEDGICNVLMRRSKLKYKKKKLQELVLRPSELRSKKKLKK